MKNAAKKTSVFLVLGVLLSGFLGAAVYAALPDTLATATTQSNTSVWEWNRTGGAPSRRVTVQITPPGPGGSTLTEVWDGTSWQVEVGLQNWGTDTALDNAIQQANSNAQAAAANDEAAELLIQSAAAVRTNLLGGGASCAPTEAELQSAMSPAQQSVFLLVAP